MQGELGSEDGSGGRAWIGHREWQEKQKDEFKMGVGKWDEESRLEK